MALADARSFLAASRNPDGSFGYRPGEPGRPEPTLLAAALGDPALGWLGENELRWCALLLPAVLSGAPGAEALVRAAIERIATLEGRRVANDPEVAGYDTEALAWPWVEGTAPWVEPTACALLSLRRAGLWDHPRAKAGLAMLLDRQCEDGGWNYGNPEVLGTQLESDLPPTAWAVMALPPGEAAARGLARLDAAVTVPSTMTRSLAMLARAAHGLDSAALAPLLMSRQDPDGGFGGRCDWTALAICALSAQDGAPHPFAGGPR